MLGLRCSHVALGVCALSHAERATEGRELVGKYSYTAIDDGGKTINGVVSASTATLARTALLDRELQPVKAGEKKSVLKFEITKKKVPRKDLMHFSRQMAVFVRAGIPILDALEIIHEE